MSLTPKNWNTFQHYKDRAPAWIKLHRGLLDDFAFARLPLASQALAPRLWLLASEYKDGQITADMEEIAFRVHAPVDDVRAAIKPLVDAGFFIDDSGALADCKQDACLEREIQEEKEEEKKVPSLRSGVRSSDEVSRETFADDWPKDYREKFWQHYPRKIGRKATYRTLDLIRKRGEVTFVKLLAGIAHLPIGEPRFIPHPTTWLNQGRWDDDPAANGGGPNGSRPGTGGARKQSAGADFFAGLASVAADISGDGGVAGPGAEEVPLGRVNIDG